MNTPLHTTPQEAEAAFYDAFQRADLDAMMAVWAEDEDVWCVHPGGPRLAELEQIRDSWRQIFSGGPGMRVELRHQQSARTPMLAVHCVHEYLSLANDRRARSVMVATNVYLDTPRGWRMLAHHASPVPSDRLPRADDPPVMLH